MVFRHSAAVRDADAHVVTAIARDVHRIGEMLGDRRRILANERGAIRCEKRADIRRDLTRSHPPSPGSAPSNPSARPQVWFEPVGFQPGCERSSAALAQPRKSHSPSATPGERLTPALQ